MLHKQNDFQVKVKLTVKIDFRTVYFLVETLFIYLFIYLCFQYRQYNTRDAKWFKQHPG